MNPTQEWQQLHTTPGAAKFLVDVEFLTKTARAVRPDVVTAEMDKMAEFLLAMAKERADKQGVTADYCLCHGSFREELKNVVQTMDVALVVLGKPAGDESAFALEELESFAAEVQNETGVETRVI